MNALKDEKHGFYAALLFLVWPLLAAASAFRNYDSRWGKNILWAFTAFYGFCFAIGAESSNSDINRYVDEFQSLHQVEMTVEKAYDYYQNSGEIDILRTTIAVSLSRFTDSQSILTLVYGIIFGFFFSRNLWFVLDRIKGKWQPITILLFFCFFLILPFWKINGFRMWTAAHIYIYGLLPYLFEGNRKRLFMCGAAILVHFSFIVPVGILLGYMLAGNRMHLYFGFFVLTFFISEINIETLNNFIESYTPEIFQERTSSYRSESQVEEYREGAGQDRVWYAVWYGRALTWSLMGFMVILYLQGRTFFTENKRWLRLFSFTLLFYGVANLLSSLPSGGRFIAIAEMLSLALIMIYIQNREQETVMKRFVWIAAPALVLYIIVAFRIGLYSMSATAILGNPLISFFFIGEHISMNDVLKMLV